MCQVTIQQIGRVEMIEKIIKYEVKVSVPSSQLIHPFLIWLVIGDDD